ncbi:MAG: HAD family hydrolase [Deltaproteobacteria bacterium]|nr:HAD family hydrolase [Deltaproteobacteria bacterium]
MNRPLGLASIRAVIFDFDGTLARLNIDFSAMRSSVRSLMTAYRVPEAASAALPVLEMIDAAEGYLRESEPDQAGSFRSEAMERVATLEIEAAGQAALLDGTRELLTDLAGRSIRTGVVTRNCRVAVLKVFPDITDFCQAFVSRDDTDKVKPHPSHLHAALRVLGALPAESVMVGDHPLDILLGHKAGTYTIGVLTGHSGRQELDSAYADMVIDKATDIINLIF